MRAPVQRAVAWCERHPLLAVALAGFVVAGLHLWWISAHRPLGTFNPDEVGYLGNSLRFQRAFTDGTFDATPSLGPLLGEVRDTTTAPLVPLLSVPFLLIGSRTVTWAMVVQPVLAVVLAVAIAGVAGRVATPRRALAAGLVALAMPGSMLAARSYLFSLGAAAVFASAVWALLASDRGRRWGPTLLFGLAVGLLPLTRTMTVAFLPALAVGAALHVERTRAAWTRLAVAGVVALVVAGPWWIATWSRSTSYLVDYGYGDVADPYGTAGIVGRVLQRFGVAMIDVRPLFVVPALALVGSAWLGIRAGGAVGPRLRAAIGRGDALVVVWIVIGLGYAALLSTANSGIAFELPLEVLAIAGLAGLVRFASPRVRALVGPVVLGVVVIDLVLVGNWRIGETVRFGDDVTSPSLAALAFGDMYQPPTGTRTPDPLELSDPGDRSRDGAAWWSAHRHVLDALERQRGDDGLLHVTVTGSGPRMNGNSLDLAGELDGRPFTGWDAPDTTDADPAPWLVPTDGEAPRAIVVIDGEGEPFPDDLEWAAFAEAARAEGWTDEAVIELPGGGSATILAPTRVEAN